MPSEDPSQKGPSNYDEIVRQLHEKSSTHKPTREVVIDPDSGEKKIRVRRKRRSSKSKRSNTSEAQAINRFINLFIGFSALIALAAAGVWFVRSKRYESPQFATQLSSQLSEQLPGTLETSNWSVSLNKIKLARASYEGELSEILQEATFTGLETSLPVSKIVQGKELHLPFLEAQNASFLLRRAQENSAEATGEKTPIQWQSPLPSSLSLEKFQIGNLAARFTGQEKRNKQNEPLGLSSAAVEFDLKSKKFSLDGGTLRVEGWPTISNLKFQGNVSAGTNLLQLNSLSAAFSTSSVEGEIGRLLGDGQIAWRGKGETKINFRSSDLAIPFGILIPENSPFTKKIRGGALIYSATLSIPATGEYISAQLTAELEFPELMFRDLKLFEDLRNSLNLISSPYFTNPQFTSSKATLSLTDGVWELNDMELRFLDEENRSEVVIYGNLSWAKRQAPQGELLVGLSSDFFSEKNASKIKETEAGLVLDDIHWQYSDDSLFYTKISVGGNNLSILSSEPLREVEQTQESSLELNPDNPSNAEEVLETTQEEEIEILEPEQEVELIELDNPE